MADLDQIMGDGAPLTNAQALRQLPMAQPGAGAPGGDPKLTQAPAEALPNVDDLLGTPAVNENQRYAPNGVDRMAKLPSVDELLAPPSAANSEYFPSGAHWDSYVEKAPLGRVLDAFGHGAAEGWGTGNLGLSDEVTEALKKAGILPDVEKGQGGLVRALNEAILRPAASALDLANRAGGALFRGAQAATEAAFGEAGADALGRDIAATPEAFFGQPHGLGTPPLAEARSMRVIGSTEGAYFGTEEPRTIPQNVTTAAVREMQDAAANTNRPGEVPHGYAEGALGPGAGEPPIQPYAPTQAPPADIHEAARRVAPGTFVEYDALGERKAALRGQIADAAAESRRQAEAQAPHAAEIADLQERLQDTTPRLAKKYEARLAELIPQRDAFLADEFTMSALARDTPEIQAMREELQRVDYRMRDLAPDISAAYRQVAPEFPEPAAEPATAPRTEATQAAQEIAPAERAPAPEAAPTPSEAAAVPEPATTPAEARAAPETAAAPHEALRAPTDIAADVAQKLVAAGRPQEEADAAAAVIQAHYEARAARFDGAKGSAADLYDAEGPEIRGGTTGGRRGAATGKAFLQDGRTVITLFQKADASTFMHETGHQWLAELLNDARDDKAPEDLRADAATVRKWLGAEGDAEITTKQHERFARGFEQYLMEGSAPSSALAEVFAKFRDWLTKLYQTVRQRGVAINDDIRDVFDRLLAKEPEPVTVAPLREDVPAETNYGAAKPSEKPATPFTGVPKEPVRLIQFLRQPTVQFPGTPHENVIPGGLKDAGGDLRAILGGAKGRPGLINNAAGRALDDAALHAWEAGYFPGHAERPTINELLDAIRDDHTGTPRYSIHDQEAADAYNNAIAHNAEVDKLASQHGVDPTGLTRDQFYDRVRQKLTDEQMADEQHRLEAAHEDAFDEAAAETRDWVESHGEPWHGDEYFGLSEPRTLEELENAYRQEDASRSAGQGPQDHAGPGSAGGPAPGGEEGIRHGGYGAGPAGRATEASAATEPGRVGGVGTAEAERPTSPNTTFAKPPADAIDKAGNIRLDNLNQPADVEQVIRDFAAQNDDFMLARRGVVSDAEIMDFADAMGVQARDLNLQRLRQISVEDNVPLGARIMAGRQMLVESATSVRDAMAKAATGADADVVAYAATKERHLMIQETLHGITAEIGRGLRAFREMEGAKAAEDLGEFLKASTGRTLFQLREEAQLGMNLETPGQVSKFIGDMNRTQWEKTKAGIISYFVNNLISGPITHAAYSIGNTTFALFKAVPETLTQATVGAVRETLAGEPIDRVYFGEAGAQLYAAVRGLRDGIAPAMKAIKTGVFVPVTDSAAIATDAAFNYRPQSIPGTAGYYLETPSRAVSGIHTLFYTMGYEQEIARLAYRDAARRGLEGDAFDAAVAEFTQSPPADMVQAAHDEAMKMVLMERPQFGGARYHLAQIVNSNLAAKIVMPFMQIGMNILKGGLVERTPLSMLSAESRAELAGERGGAARDLRIGKIAVGSMLATATVGLAAEGLITGGGPADPNKRRVLEESGWKAYSLKFGDNYIPYRKYLGPLGPLVAASSDIYEIGHILDQEGLTRAASAATFGFAEVVADETWMAGLSNFIDAARHWDTKGEQYFRGLVTSFLPFSSMLNQTAHLVDPYQRQARTLLDAVRSKVPFLSEGLEPQISIWGQPIPSHMMISPSVAKNDPVDQKLIELDMGVTRPERKIRGVELSDKQYTEFATSAGRMAKMRLDALVGTPGFSQLPNGVQERTIRETISNARETARTLMMMKNPEIMQHAIDVKRAQITGANQTNSPAKDQ